MSALLVKALAALVAMATVVELAVAKNYMIQWSLSGNYGDWSSDNAVSVGDTVVFMYGPPHNVNELPSEADYKACSFAKSVSEDTSGNTAVTFDKAGTRYFACDAGSPSHCSQGQKVAITATAPGASPAPKPKENSAAAVMVGAVGLAVKLVLCLGVGGAVLAAF